MSGQDYDFFATGRPAAPEPVAPPPPPARARGTFVDPDGRAVNQFGTPIDVAASPAGPSAAPGYGAQTYGGHGLTSDGAAPAVAPPNRFGGPPGPVPPPPGAYAPPVPPGAYARSDQRPGTVLAAGIVGIVEGGLLVVAALFVLLGGAALSAQLGGSDLPSLFVVMAVVLAAFAALYLAAGIGAVRSRRWAVWTLLVVHALAAALNLVQMVVGARGGAELLVSLLIEVAVVVLLVLPASWAWLRRTL